MTAIKHGDADRFIAGGGKGASVFLIYGPDRGLVEERAAALIRHTVADPHDPFLMVRLDGDEIASDPQRLIDEALTIPMFGGKRTIRVLLGGRAIHPAVEPLLESPPQDCAVVIEAGELRPNHVLRAMVEKSPHGAAIACYEDDASRLARLIDEELTANGLKVQGDARAALIDVLGANRSASRLELRKLADYARGEQEVTLAHIEAIVGDVGRHEIDALIDATFLGELAAIEREAKPLLRAGNGAQMIVSAALRHALLLHGLLQPGSRHGAESFALSRLPFQRKPLVERQHRHWTLAKIERALAILHEAQLNSRRYGAMGGAVVERALWSIALAAKR